MANDSGVGDTLLGPSRYHRSLIDKKPLLDPFRKLTVIETERLHLRQLAVEDAEFIFGLLNEPSFLHYIGDKGIRTLEDARSYILTGPVASYEKNGFGLWLVELRSSSEPIGICGLLKRDSLPDVDVGFAFLPRFWSRGYALRISFRCNQLWRNCDRPKKGCGNHKPGQCCFN